MVSENRRRRFPGGSISLKESLFLGFCALFILFLRMAMRWHLGLSGHTMFFMVPLLLLARGSVRHPLAATIAGLLAGVMAIFLGLGKGGVLILLKFLLPALVIDGAAATIPSLFRSYWLCALVAALASSTRFLTTGITDLLVGVDPVIALQHALVKSGAGILFGVAGSLLIPTIISKLKSRGVI